MGGAMHQNRGRQDFFGARGPGPLPGPGLIASCAQTGNFFVTPGLTVKTQIPLNPSNVRLGFCKEEGSLNVVQTILKFANALFAEKITSPSP
jgi:hypothetical protein